MGTITVTNLGKAYKQYASRWSRLVEWLDPRDKPRHQLHWALQDINFTVRTGEALGIIGINGAGKSTLLKLITGTSQPTEGQVSVTGRVAALLELGMGFHPDFTGRQNAYMAGQLLGYSIKEIDDLMPEIVEFAEVGDYIEQPVRVYSSGMQMRLAFSVATASRPDVLIIDEALSVGDSYFQHRSFERIRKFRNQGTTLLLVSHDKQAIQSICDRAILLNSSRVAMEGAPEAVMDYYNAILVNNQNQKVEQIPREDGSVQTISGSGEASVKDVFLSDASGREVETIGVGQLVSVKVSVQINQAIPKLVVGFAVKDRLGQFIYGTNTEQLNKVLIEPVVGQAYLFDIQFEARLGVGQYSIAIALSGSSSHVDHNYEWRDLALIFNVINIKYPEFSGVAWLQADITMREE